jgi:S-adenosylmethionine/arginine decarboxylase-like enzyme
MGNIEHNHLIIRAETTSYPSESKKNTLLLNSSLDKLIIDIGMKIVLPSRCAYVDKDRNEGYTGQAGLETSHITYHIWNSPERKVFNNKKGKSLVQLDVYTCGCLLDEHVVKVLDWIELHCSSIIHMHLDVLDRSKGLRYKPIFLAPSSSTLDVVTLGLKQAKQGLGKELLFDLNEDTEWLTEEGDLDE